MDIPSKDTIKLIKQMYEDGENIMEYFRDIDGSEENELSSILLSYDLQAGTYVEALNNITHKEFNDNYTSALANIITKYDFASVLEAGVGEATTLCNMVKKLKTTPDYIGGFDISWSRLHYAKNYCTKLIQNKNNKLFVGDLLSIPIPDSSYDIVYTSHSVEPNTGKESEAISELYRITSKYLILLEPSYELGNADTRKRIEEHGYCQNFYKTVCDLGYKIIEYRLFEYSSREDNQTAVIIIEKDSNSINSNVSIPYACPHCQEELLLHKDNYYCKECSLLYPVVGNIPCLLVDKAIFASKYLEL